MKMKIGTKILSGFGVVLALLAICVTIAEVKMGAIGDTTMDLAETFVPLSNKIGEVQASQLAQHVDMLSYIVDHKQERIQAFAELGREAETLFKEVEDLVNTNAALASSGFMREIKELDDDHMKFEKESEKLFEMVKEGKTSGSEYTSAVATIIC